MISFKQAFGYGWGAGFGMAMGWQVFNELMALLWMFM